MPFEFIQIPANGQEALNAYLRVISFASLRKEFVANEEDSSWGLHRSVRGKTEVRLFGVDLDWNLERMRREILGHSFENGGYKVFEVQGPDRRSKLRCHRCPRILAVLHFAASLSENALQRRHTATTAFVRRTRAHGFRLRSMETIGCAAIGRELDEPGRHLEQQRDQLPRCERLQQYAQHPQQHFPLAGCDKTTACPPGASSPVDARWNTPRGLRSSLPSICGTFCFFSVSHPLRS